MQIEDTQKGRELLAGWVATCQLHIHPGVLPRVNLVRDDDGSSMKPC